jgi:hypothetical protein
VTHVTHDKRFLFPPRILVKLPTFVVSGICRIACEGEALASFVLCSASLRHHIWSSLGPHAFIVGISPVRISLMVCLDQIVVLHLLEGDSK